MHIVIADPKELMSAAIGAGVGLGGLLLIFAGLLFGQAALMGEARDSTINAYKWFARIGLVPFAVALAMAALASTYFVVQSPAIATAVYEVFLALIVATIAYGIVATKYL